MPFLNKLWKLIDKPSSGLLKLKNRKASHDLNSSNNNHRTATDRPSIEEDNRENINTINDQQSCTSLAYACEQQSTNPNAIKFIISADSNDVIVKGSKVTRHLSVSRSGRYKTKSRRRSAMTIEFDQDREKDFEQELERFNPDAEPTAAVANCDFIDTIINQECISEMCEIEIGYSEREMTTGSSDDSSSQNSH